MGSRFLHFLSREKWTLVALILVTPIGFLTKEYSGPAEAWVQNSLGGVLYVIFWCLVLSLLFRWKYYWRPVVLVFLITSMLEFLQRWHPPFLEAIRSTYLGVTLLGNSFVWSDLFYYLIGALLALLFLYFIKGKKGLDHSSV